MPDRTAVEGERNFFLMEPPDWRSWSAAEWERLAELRERFIKGIPGDYWQDDRDLELYDAVFGQRIAWKWGAVLEAWQRAGAVARTDLVWDWGCGSGVGGHLVADFLQAKKVVLTDRSPRAVRHAAIAHRQCGRRLVASAEASDCCLVISHVLGELPEEGRRQLWADSEAASTILLVEPGDRKHGHLLAAARNEWIGRGWQAMLPCPHQDSCPAIASRTGHWCHFFARPPSLAFQSAFWRAVSERLGLDLRSLPVSFLILQKQPAPAVSAPGHGRILGRPVLHKAWTELLLCQPDGDLREKRWLKRENPHLYRALRKRVEFPGVFPELPTASAPAASPPPPLPVRGD